MPIIPFQLLGVSHLMVLSLTAVAGVAMIALRRNDSRWAAIADRLLIACLALQWPASLIAHHVLGDFSIQSALPFHLCDVAAFAGMVALLTRHQLAVEWCYFFGLAATFQGLLTPALREDFPHPRFFAFFLEHSSVVVAAIYLVAGLRLTPGPRAPVRMLGWLAVYATLVGVINAVLHTNYGFVCEKPPSPSLMDVLGPWPWYIGGIAVVALVVFTLLDLPFVGRRKMDLSLPRGNA